MFCIDKLFRWTVLGMMFLLLGSMAATGAEQAAAKIGAVVFEQVGGKPVAEDLLRFNVRQQPGEDYNLRLLDEDIKRLHELGYFSDITAQGEPQADGKMKVRFKLKLHARVSAVVFDGNQKFDTDDLAKLVDIAVDAPLNERNLRDGANALREFYRDKGYYDAEVATVFERSKDNTVKIIFKIKENLKLKVNDVLFENNTVFSSWTLRHALANRYNCFNWIGFLNLGLLDREALEVDKVRLRDMYWNKGYLDFKIESLQIAQCEDDPEFVNLLFKLHEGEPYTVSAIKVEGAKSFEDAEFMELLKITPGEVFDYQKESADRSQILSLLHSEGFADASCNVRREADFATHTVALHFVINEGRKYSVSEVTIVGNEFTQDKVIRRELVIYPGDPADANLLDVSKSRLMNMDMFEQVETNFVSGSQLDRKNAVIKVKEKNAYDVRVGAGFSDVDSLFGMIEASSRNFDITNPANYFRGGGQRVRLQAAFGIERAALNFDFTEPWLFDIPLRLDVSAYLRESVFEYWDETRWGARVGLTKKFFDDFTSATLAYKFEQVNVHDMSRRVGPETRDERGRDWVSQFSLELDRTTLDSLTDPKNGYQLNLLGAVSPKVFGSSEDFYRAEAKMLLVKSFWDDAITVQMGGRIGAVGNFHRESAPLYERYFLGGSGTLRGFPYREVSPVDSRGKEIGGQSMSVFTLEVSHPIWNFIRGAAFMDAGGVSASEYDFGFDHFNIGVGYGLRLKLPHVPVPIKLDLAFPVLNNQDNVSSKLRFHFNMGVSF
ncbi:MAG: outer membrane protein assembly factor BamA [Lentisphaerae bacterium]|nr:outer membrane protein assembly factor BamA [Lentisphaerota bacterium]